MKKRSIATLILILLAVAVTAFVAGCNLIEEDLTFTTEYQAVFMDNGQVFFGKLEKAGSAHPVLREVYYIGREASPDGKEVKNILLKRGSEWHGPDVMYLNGSHIAMIEPVSPSSRVMELINELKSKQQETQTIN